MKNFTHCWRSDTWDGYHGRVLAYTAGNGLKKRGLEPGDRVYIVTNRGGQMCVGGRIDVARILNRIEARRVLGNDLWDAEEFAIPAAASTFRSDVLVPQRMTRQLRFLPTDQVLKIVRGRVDQQTLRGLRQLTPGSAAELDRVLGIETMAVPDILKNRPLAGSVAATISDASTESKALEFWDRDGRLDHDRFQLWRKSHPLSVFLTLGNSGGGRIHGSKCFHLGNTSWKQGKNKSSLTTHRKVCADSVSPLLVWAAGHAVRVTWCEHCIRDGYLPGRGRLGRPDPEELDSLADQAIEQRTDIGPTEKQYLRKSRIGQSIYRSNLEKIERKCRVTGLDAVEYLRASHIKPWRDSDDREKLDGSNGLLLSPHVDLLFDEGHISFADNGDLLVSRHLDPRVLPIWGIRSFLNAGRFRPEQCQYLEYHRRHVFQRSNVGNSDRRHSPQVS